MRVGDGSHQRRRRDESSGGASLGWIGLGRPGAGTLYTGSWNFGRNGLWNYVVDPPPPAREWARGVFDGNAAFGSGSHWSFARVPLTELTSADRVRELVAMPLLAEWKRAIRNGK